MLGKDFIILKEMSHELSNVFFSPKIFKDMKFVLHAHSVFTAFADVSAIEHKNQSVLQSFISGKEDPYIRQRILEKDVNLRALGNWLQS